MTYLTVLVFESINEFSAKHYLQNLIVHRVIKLCAIAVHEFFSFCKSLESMSKHFLVYGFARLGFSLRENQVQRETGQAADHQPLAEKRTHGLREML